MRKHEICIRLACQRRWCREASRRHAPTTAEWHELAGADIEEDDDPAYDLHRARREPSACTRSMRGRYVDVPGLLNRSRTAHNFAAEMNRSDARSCRCQTDRHPGFHAVDRLARSCMSRTPATPRHLLALVDVHDAAKGLSGRGPPRPRLAAAADSASTLSRSHGSLLLRRRLTTMSDTSAWTMNCLLSSGDHMKSCIGASSWARQRP